MKFERKTYKISKILQKTQKKMWQKQNRPNKSQEDFDNKKPMKVDGRKKKPYRKFDRITNKISKIPQEKQKCQN